jgi:hypothetical protein
MNRSAKTVLTALALLLTASAARADWGSCTYGGYQPWWNIFAHRNHYQTCEEKRLQRFWHDYYDALGRYYGGLEHMDWVAYYKNHGYRINAGVGGGGPGCCGDGPVQFAPVAMTPGMSWASPSAASCAPPIGPSGPYAGPMGFGPGGPGGPGCGPMGCGPMGCGPMGCGPMGPMGPGGPGPVAPAGYMGYMGGYAPGGYPGGYAPGGYAPGGYAPGMGMPMPIMPAGYFTPATSSTQP